MPLKVFQAIKPGRCPHCSSQFTIFVKSTEDDPAECGICGSPVAEVRSAPNSPKIAKPTSISDAKAQGFTVLKKIGKGEYEKQ